MSILLELFEKRITQDQGINYPTPFTKDAVQFPLKLVIPKPAKAPIFYDKIKLMELGLNDLEAEILLILWEHGKPMFIRNRRRETDLVRESEKPRTTVQTALARLEKLGFIERVNGPTGTIAAKSPDILAKIIEDTLSARLESIIAFLLFKHDEILKKDEG